MGKQDKPIIEIDNRLRSVTVIAVPVEDGPEHLARCFTEAAKLIRKGRLKVRGLALIDLPEGLVLFCDRETR